MAITTRRVVTGHDVDGKAIVIMDGPPPRPTGTKSTVQQAVFWVNDATPASNRGDADAAERDIGIPPPEGGAIFRVVVFPPRGAASESETGHLSSSGATVPEGARHPGMHRTNSVDYAVVIDGEIDMLLDESEVHVKAGDVVVQRGTNHAWANRGDKPCSIAFVLIDAEPAI